jgi:hypothetical protein
VLPVLLRFEIKVVPYDGSLAVVATRARLFDALHLKNHIRLRATVCNLGLHCFQSAGLPFFASIPELDELCHIALEWAVILVVIHHLQFKDCVRRELVVLPSPVFDVPVENKKAQQLGFRGHPPARS